MENLQTHIKRLFPLAVILVTIVPFEASALPDPVVEWEVKLEHFAQASPVAYPSGSPDGVLLGEGGRLARIANGGGIIYNVAFGPETQRGGIADPVLADLDGDGEEEVVTVHKAGWVVALNPKNGAELWSTRVDGPIEGWQMPTVADVDSDGKSEVLMGNLHGWLTCLDHDGNLQWRTKIEQFRISTPAVADINNDGEPEIVFGTATRYMVALDGDGRLLWRTIHPPHHLGRTKPYIDDLDGDGSLEIYTNSSMLGPGVGLLSLNGDGSVRWVGETWHKAYNALAPLAFPDGSKGIVVCDKGANVAAYADDGSRRWRTRVDGRGIWKAPTVADLDGDGSHEISVGVRGGAKDGSGRAWYVLNLNGEVVAAYPRAGQYGSQLVADIDADGLLEVVMISENRTLTAYTFGGSTSSDAVVTTSPGPRSSDTSTVAAAKLSTKPTAGILTATPHLGSNQLQVPIPGNNSDRYALEVSTLHPDGTRTTQLFHTADGRSPFSPKWPVFSAGEHRLEWVYFDLVEGIVTERIQTDVDVEDPFGPLRDEVQTIAARAQKLQEQAFGEAQITASLKRVAADVDIAFTKLQQTCDKSDSLSVYERWKINGRIAAFKNELAAANSLIKLIAVGNDETFIPFAFWQDSNPWDNQDPRVISAANPNHELQLWAFGNETESVVANLANVSADPITLRVDPGIVSRTGETIGPAHFYTTLHRTVFLPTVFGDIVPDMLPELDDAFLIDLAPGEVRQLWINVDTQGLESGDYVLEWPIRQLHADAATRILRVKLHVSSVRLPEENAYYAGFWSQNVLGHLDPIPDQNAHLQNIVHRMPLPGAHADAEGNLIGELDWTPHNRIIAAVEQPRLIVYSGGLPVPAFPADVTVTDELRLTAQRNYFEALLEQLAQYGLDYEDIVFYVEDETGLDGEHDHYMSRAAANKAVDPRVRNYANPAGGITVDMIRDMEPLTDFWQPVMESIEYLGPEYLKAMRGDTRKPITTYTPPGSTRNVPPLGFFRSQAWFAAGYGIEGGGWWVYQSDDLFASSPDREPSYGGVNYDGRTIVGSRRWEAQRDGVEDFNMITLLRETLAETPDVDAQRVLDTAIAYVFNRVVTGMPREAADYELDWDVFQDHRAAIRDALERLGQPE